MLAIVISCVIVMVLTYYQVFQQGLFSSLIMAVCCISSAAIALGFYEPLAAKLMATGLRSFAPKTVCVVGLFVICLLILRECFDRLIRGNMNFPLIIDRAGAAVFSLIASMTIAGMIAIGIQMLPIGGKFLFFDRYPDIRDLDDSKTLFPNADGFVAAIMSRTSNYCFSGASRFAQHHPDFIRELHMNRLALDPASRRNADPDSVTLIGKPTVVEGYLRDTTGKVMIEAQGDEKLVRVKLAIKGPAGKDSDGAADVDGLIRFAMGNIRLVGFDSGQQAGRQAGVSQYPIGVFTMVGDDERVEILPLDEGKVLQKAGPVAFLFRWPGPLKETPPQYVEFKRSERLKVAFKSGAGESG